MRPSRGTRLVAARAASVVLLAPLLGLAVTEPAQADGTGGNPIDGGYTTTAMVVYTGNAAPGGPGGSSTHTIPVYAPCWFTKQEWLPGGYDVNDPAAVKKWYQYMLPFMVNPAHLGPASMYDEAIAQAAAGQHPVFYGIFCDSKHSSDEHAASNLPEFAWSLNGPPAPPVDPQSLAEQAEKDMVIAVPRLERNPKISAVEDATLVHLPTWFWVRDPMALGAGGGDLTIRAQVVNSPVFAEVTAHTDGVTITSEAGGTFCDRSAALTTYAAGAAESGACTVTFDHASVGLPGGFGVAATTAWHATWTGDTQDGASVTGDLPGLNRDATTTVPVAESQALVNGSR